MHWYGWIAVAFAVYVVVGLVLLAYYAITGAPGQAMPAGCWVVVWFFPSFVIWMAGSRILQWLGLIESRPID